MKTILMPRPDILARTLTYDCIVPQYILCNTTDDPDTVIYTYKTSCRETLLGVLYEFICDGFSSIHKNIENYKIGLFCIPNELSLYIRKIIKEISDVGIKSHIWRNNIIENLMLKREEEAQKLQVSSNLINIIEEKLGWNKSSINMCKIKYTDDAGKDHHKARHILKNNELDYVPVCIIEGNTNFLISSQALSLYLLLVRLPLSELGYNIYKHVDSFDSLMGAIEEHRNALKHCDEKIFIEHYRYWFPFLKNVDYIYKDLSFHERFNSINSYINKSGIYDLTSKQFKYCPEIVGLRYKEVIKFENLDFCKDKCKNYNECKNHIFGSGECTE